MSIDMKEPILRNEFETESTLGDGDAENPLLVPATTPDVAPKRKRGPKTAAGKARSSRNAVKHGILSPHPVVIEGIETVGAWEEFEGGIVESWQPVGLYERELAIDVAYGLWRLRRCRIHESAVLSQQVEEVEDDLQLSDADEDGTLEDEQAAWPEIEPERLRSHQRLKVIPDGWSFDRIVRYEVHVKRALVQTIHELEAHQARRVGERTPLARVDFSAAPSARRPSAAGSSTLQQINQDMARAEREIAARKRARSQSPPNGHHAERRGEGTPAT